MTVTLVCVTHTPATAALSCSKPPVRPVCPFSTVVSCLLSPMLGDIKAQPGQLIKYTYAAATCPSSRPLDSNPRPGSLSASYDGPMPVGFLDLSSELRDCIYELSGCLLVYQCADCRRTVSGEQLSIFGSPDPIRTDRKNDRSRGPRRCSGGYGRALCNDWQPANLLLNNPWQEPRRTELSG